MYLMNTAELPTAPGRTGTDTAISTPDVGSSSQAVEILNLMRELNSAAQPDQTAYREAMTEDPAAKRRRIIGSLIAGALGALANRRTREGGLAGFAAGASGFNQGAQSREQTTQAVKLKNLEADREQRGKMALGTLEHVVPKLMEIKARREGSWGSGSEHTPAQLQIFNALKDNPELMKQYQTFMVGMKPGVEQSTDKLAASIFQKYQKTGVLTPGDKQILDTIVKMRTYPGLAPGAAMGMYGLPSPTAGMGGGADNDPLGWRAGQ